MAQVRMSEPIFLGAALALLLAGLGLRLWMYQQPWNTDDLHYIQQALQASGPVADTHSMRWVLLGVIRFWGLFIGYSLTTFYLAVYTLPVIAWGGILVFCRVAAGPVETLWVLFLWATSFVFIMTETRLMPDALGTGLALAGLAAVLWAGGLGRSPVATVSRDGENRGAVFPIALVGGLLLVAAYGARCSFASFSLAALALVPLAPAARRRPLLLGLGSGLAAGLALELAWFWISSGNPLLRIETLLFYPEQVSDNKLFQGLTWLDLALRYFRLLYNTGSAEIFVFLLGWVGVVAWLVAGGRRNQALLIIFLINFGVIAFSVVRVDPPVPLLRATERYYVTAAPLFFRAWPILLPLLLLGACGGPDIRTSYT
ncbi:MAG: hypothetical protein HQL82_16570, partial [Magnetococcales bacterium]|nr:hypothetical protein [Magnetococcales bacterium]